MWLFYFSITTWAGFPVGWECVTCHGVKTSH